MEGVEDFTIIQSLNGVRTSLYFERAEADDGYVRFRAVHPERSSFAGIEGVPGGTDEVGGKEAMASAADPFSLFGSLLSEARLEGTERVDGREAYVIFVEDLPGLESDSDVDPQYLADDSNAGFDPGAVKIWLDRERYVVLRTRMTATVTRAGQEAEISLDSRLEDYQEAGGMLYPFRTEVTVSGLQGALSPGQNAELQRAREQLERELEGMSEAQRAMVERMMKDRMPDPETGDAMGKVTYTIQVEELRVNEGPPSARGRSRPRRPETSPRRGQRGAPDPVSRPEARSASGQGRGEAAAESPLTFEAYHGVYGNPDRPNRRFFVSESCTSATLLVGAMWGDVAPWGLTRVDGEEFAGSFNSGDPIRAHFRVGSDGTPEGMTFMEGFDDYGFLQRIRGPEESERPCLGG
jgi:hypothetical protein